MTRVSLGEEWESETVVTLHEAILNIIISQYKRESNIIQSFCIDAHSLSLALL